MHGVPATEVKVNTDYFDEEKNREERKERAQVEWIRTVKDQSIETINFFPLKMEKYNIYIPFNVHLKQTKHTTQINKPQTSSLLGFFSNISPLPLKTVYEVDRPCQTRNYHPQLVD